MIDDGTIGGMERVEPTHTVFVHLQAHMAQAGIEPRTLRTRGERSSTEPLRSAVLKN